MNNKLHYIFEGIYPLSETVINPDNLASDEDS